MLDRVTKESGRVLEHVEACWQAKVRVCVSCRPKVVTRAPKLLLWNASFRRPLTFV
jgi:hypothetical protein